MFRIDYSLGEHGWAIVKVRVEDTELSTHVSYIGAPLHELALTAIKVLDPTIDPPSHPHTLGLIKFAGEPDGLILDVVDEVSGSFTFRHYEKTGLPPAETRKVFVTLSYSEDADNEKPDRQELAIEEISAVEFGTEAYRVLASVVDESGLQGYYDRWMGYFPLVEFAHLGRVLKLPTKTIPLW